MKQTIAFFFLGFSLAVAVIEFVYYESNGFRADPKAGEVWKYEPADTISQNPFLRSYKIIEYDSVIAVKDGYVQYQRAGFPGPFSSTIHQFKIEEYKIKP